LAHNIRGHSREGPSGPSSLVFPNRFPCAETGLAAHPRANAYGWDPFWRFLPWGPSGRKISITPIYYPSVRGRATKSRAYAARARSTRPFTSEPMRTESAVSLKINLSPARTIIARVRAARSPGHVTLADARRPKKSPPFRKSTDTSARKRNCDLHPRWTPRRNWLSSRSSNLFQERVRRSFPLAVEESASTKIFPRYRDPEHNIRGNERCTSSPGTPRAKIDHPEDGDAQDCTLPCASDSSSSKARQENPINSDGGHRDGTSMAEGEECQSHNQNILSIFDIRFDTRYLTGPVARPRAREGALFPLFFLRHCRHACRVSSFFRPRVCIVRGTHAETRNKTQKDGTSRESREAENISPARLEFPPRYLVIA